MKNKSLSPTLSKKKGEKTQCHFNNNRINSIVYCLLSISLFSCQPPAEQQSEEKKIVVIKINAPDFNPDSAYVYVKTQVDFGPRIPGSKAHEKCADFMSQKLKSLGWEVIVQKATATTFDTKKYAMKNIIGSYNTQSGKRILLCAHWDTRPFADRDSVDTDKPINGANDGASGVGVLLEVARMITTLKPKIGVDIILFDLEDYGQPHESKFPEQEDTWCLGTQYWAKNLHKPGYFAEYAILLDMVGAKNATFPMEGTSMYYAPSVVEKVWNVAAKIGYSNYFIPDKTGETTDDHLYVNALAHIPCIDIVNYNPITRDYPPFHHRHSDNLDLVDKQTLKAVGQTLLELVYSEN